MKKILLFNFYKGILYRGIPVYSSNLVIALKKKGCVVNEWSCPVHFRKLPRFIIDIIFVLCEQIIMPLICFINAYDKVIYPYNSCSILSSLNNKSILIIHDFIPNKKIKEKVSLTGLYIIITQRIHALLRRDVAYVSSTTKRIGQNVAWLKKSNSYLLPNSFYILEDKLSKLHLHKICSESYVVLISGNSENKELHKALSLWKSCDGYKLYKLKIIGLGGNVDWSHRIVKKSGVERIEILPVLTDDELLTVIKNSKFLWAHSTHEGFGRPIIEGRICGKNVLASNISAFREHEDGNVFLYKTDSFNDKYCLAASQNCTQNYYIKYHITLEEQIEKWLLIH